MKIGDPNFKKETAQKLYEAGARSVSILRRGLCACYCIIFKNYTNKKIYYLCVVLWSQVKVKSEMATMATYARSNGFESVFIGSSSFGYYCHIS